MSPEEFGQMIRESQEQLHSDFQDTLDDYYEHEEKVFNGFQELINK